MPGYGSYGLAINDYEYWGEVATVKAAPAPGTYGLSIRPRAGSNAIAGAHQEKMALKTGVMISGWDAELASYLQGDGVV